MENGGVKNIVLIALVVVLSFIVGSLSVDGLKQALMPIAMIAGAFVMLYIGENSKYFIFYLPPLLQTFGLFEVGCAVPALVFLGWLVMRFLGHVRLQWIGNMWADGIVLIFLLYMGLSFYRNPVTVSALGLEVDLMGGRDYIFLLIGVIGYIGISFLPFSCLELCKSLRNLAFLKIFFALVGIGLNLIGRGASGAEGMNELGEEAVHGRFTLFSSLGQSLCLLIYAIHPLHKIVTSPRKIAVMLLCLIGIFFSGWRGAIIGFVSLFYMISFFKRELTFLIALGGMAYAGILFLSSEHAFDNMPMGVQRSLRAFPGVHVSKAVEIDTQGSSDWRKEMWGWALDPRTHYIKDYVWGDGPGVSQSASKRMMTAVMRGKAQAGDNVYFARTGTWHSGFISTLHRYGMVGLALTVIYFLIFILLSIIQCFRYRLTKYYPYIVIYSSITIPSAISYYLNSSFPAQIFVSFTTLAVYKLLYAKARELGRDDSFFRSEPYTPLMIQDLNEQENEQQSLVKARVFP